VRRRLLLSNLVVAICALAVLFVPSVVLSARHPGELAAILGAATTAFAAEAPHKTTGRIKSVDLMTHVITLEDGSTYKVARGVNITRMKPGEKVTVTPEGIGMVTVFQPAASVTASRSV